MKLQAIDLRVFYGKQEALGGVSLAVPDRSCLALIGPSGCGKSTFLRALNRMHDLVPGTSMKGRILLDGQDTALLAPEELRCRVGMVFQRPNPFPMSIYDNVAFGPSLFGVRGRELNQIVTEALTKAALYKEVRSRLRLDARGLSGGQQQRLCIARALALAPEVLLMDEPCSALDPAATEAIEQLIFSLKREMAVVLVTHSMRQAGRVADTAAAFRDGRLEAVGEPAKVLEAVAEAHSKWA